MVDFKATTQGGKGTLAVFFADGDSKTLQSTHPTYTETLTYLVATPADQHDEDYVRELVNPALRLGRALQAVDPKYGFDLYTLSYDGFPLSGPLADLIKDRLTNGKHDWERFAKFAARLESNPSHRAKQSLFQFIEGKRLTILADGRFVGHKGVRSDGLSAHAGPNNFIDGVLYGKAGESVRVPHAVGTVISKRRGDVDDSSMACSTGLHVGSHEYARDFADVLLTVAVAPEDVVGGEMGWKFRTERYEVIGFNEDGSDFVSDDYEIVDRSDVLSDGEKAFAVGTKVRARDHQFSDEERAQYNSLPSVGRRLYDDLRTVLNKSHRLAYETALADFGTYEEWVARRDEERETARLEAEQDAAQAAAEAAHEEALDAAERGDNDPVVDQSSDTALADESVEVLFGLPTMDEKAAASPALKADLASTTIGHKPLARKWVDAGVTESSVRRYRKAHHVNLTFGTKVKDALS